MNLKLIVLLPPTHTYTFQPTVKQAPRNVYLNWMSEDWTSHLGTP